MAEDAGQQPPSSLDEFSKRLDAARGARKDAGTTRADGGRPSGQAFRLSSELLAALIVGLVLGWGLDRLLGIAPWGILAGVFLGFAAGVLNVARVMKAQQAELPATEEAGETGEKADLRAGDRADDKTATDG
ncbi:MAG: AtpZ/AtpI family protein [Parvularculaceae bacterium]|nr:AtpZ/AtpI family protein [Parvularculaceae bacterium]